MDYSGVNGKPQDGTKLEVQRESSAHTEMTVVKRAMAMTKWESGSDGRLGITDRPFEDGYQGFRYKSK